MQSSKEIEVIHVKKDELTPTKEVVSSEKSSNDSNDQSSESVAARPPRATLQQYLTVLSAFMVFLNTWGLLLAFGSFQDYYQRVLLKDRTGSEISWISTTCAFLLLVAGILTGPAFDHGYLRPMLLVGSLLEVFGLMMISLSTEYYQVFLAQAVCIGLGGGMLYIPSIAAAATAVKKPETRAKVMGLVAAATGIGGIIYPIMFDQLLPRVGFGWTVRIIAFVMLAGYMFSYLALFYAPRKALSVRQFIDISAVKDVPFVGMWLCGFFAGLGYYTPLLYLPLFARTHTADFSTSTLAVYLIAIINGASVFGRVFGGLVAAKIGPLETFASALVGCSALLFCWVAVKSTVGVVVWCVFWGLVSSVLVSLPGAFVPLLSPSLSVVGTRSGMWWTSVGLGILLGSPIGGVIIDRGHTGQPKWWPLQVFAGIVMLIAALLAVQPILYIRRKKLMQ